MVEKLADPVPRRSSLTVGIPALNEEKNIESTLRTVLSAAAKTPSLPVEMIVVDDGSTDRTADIVQELARRHSNIRLIRNAENLGLGASIRRAMESATTDKFLFIPGDNDIPLATLELLFRNAHVAEVVMCYFHNEEIRARPRLVLSTVFRMIYTICFEIYVQYINGPAIYPLAKLKELKLRSTRFSIVAEINVKLLRQGVTFVEVPGTRQVGLAGSTSLSWRSLLETIRVFLHLIFEVYVRNADRYGKRPVRVPVEVTVRAVG
jgi:glycosyltransferase involved in cell wall biosynthesis